MTVILRAIASRQGIASDHLVSNAANVWHIAAFAGATVGGNSDALTPLEATVLQS